MKKNIKSLIIVLSIFIVSGFLICVNVDQALSAYDFKEESGLSKTGEGLGYSKEMLSGGEYMLPLKIGNVIEVVLAFVGVLFLILMIYGGYIWMMARGNEQETEKAKKIIQNALIGIVVVLAAYAITTYIALENRALIDVDYEKLDLPEVPDFDY